MTRAEFHGFPPPVTHYLNRETGQLAFTRRVLAMAGDEHVPLLERLKYLCIVSSILDEFFEIRVAGIKEKIKLEAVRPGPDGMTPPEVFNLVSAEAHELVAEQYLLLNNTLLPELERQGICFLKRDTWTDAQRAWIRDYFMRELLPVLTPIGLDPAHPFPRVLNKSLNFAIELEGRDAFGRKSSKAIVQAPRSLPRFIRLPDEIAGCAYGFVFLSSVLHAHVDELFTGMTVIGSYQFRVTRNSDLFVDEEEVKNLRIALQGELPQRNFGAAVRLEVADVCSEEMANFLMQQFNLEPRDIYRVNGPVNLARMLEVPDMIDLPALKYSLFVPGVPVILEKIEDIFQAMRKQDILLHHPYQSFKPVVHLIQQAAADTDVVAIKQTIYRTGTDSELMEALVQAASRGKEVTVVVELMARFDEEANLGWAGRLEEVGAHVIYGVVGYKTHAKMAMVIRREDNRLRRYVHLGTGNYHARTTRFYTDFGLLTANEDICADVGEIFKQLTGLGKAGSLKYLWQAPFTLHKQVLHAIRNETKIAKSGKPARIVAKVNALIEPEVIEALYAASQAGVKIDLIVRGLCTLRPGIPGLSDNIRVRSVIGRFLEHSRIYCFRNERKYDVYLASADWMGRNFFGRIELAFPILDKQLKKRVIGEGLKPYLEDNCEAWEMDGNGHYRRIHGRRGKRLCAQQELIRQLAAVKVDDSQPL